MTFLRSLATTVQEQLESNTTTTNNTAQQDAASQSDEDRPFLIMLTVMVACICSFFAICVYQILRIWICKRTPIGLSLEETVLVHEGRIFNLTGDQRRAVLESIFSESSKPVTEQDLTENKKKRRVQRKAREGNSGNIEKGNEGEALTIPDNDDVPNDVEILVIPSSQSKENIADDWFGGRRSNDIAISARTRSRTASSDNYCPSLDLDDDFDGEDPIAVVDQSYVQEPPGCSPYEQHRTSSLSVDLDDCFSGDTLKQSTIYENYDGYEENEEEVNIKCKLSYSGCESGELTDEDLIRQQLSYESCESRTRNVAMRSNDIFRDQSCEVSPEVPSSDRLFPTRILRRRNSTGSICTVAHKFGNWDTSNGNDGDKSCRSRITPTIATAAGTHSRCRTMTCEGNSARVYRRLSSDIMYAKEAFVTPSNSRHGSISHTLLTPRWGNFRVVSPDIFDEPSDDTRKANIGIHTTCSPNSDQLTTQYYDFDDTTKSSLVLPILLPSSLGIDSTEDVNVTANQTMVPFRRAFTFPAFQVEAGMVLYDEEVEEEINEYPPLPVNDFASIQNDVTTNRRRRAKNYSIPENHPIVEENLSISVGGSGDATVGKVATGGNTARSDFWHQSTTPDSEESKDEMLPVIAKLDEAYGDSFDEDEITKKRPPTLAAPAPLQRHESFSTVTSEYTFDDDSTTGENVCSICLCGYKKGDILVVSKRCPHVFHKDCILEWLEKHDECPCCRTGMITDSELSHAATSLVGKTRMYHAVASMQSSSTPVQLFNRQLQLHHQQNQHRTPPHSPHGNFAGSASRNRGRNNTGSSNGSNSRNHNISPMHPSPLQGMVRRGYQ